MFPKGPRGPESGGINEQRSRRPSLPGLTLSLAIFCRWICGHGERVEGPSSCWQRRLAAEPGHVSRRPSRLPGSPPRHHGPARLVSFQPMTWSRFPAAALGSKSRAPGTTLGPQDASVLGGVDLGPPWPPGCTQSPTALHPSFLASEGETVQLSPGVTVNGGQDSLNASTVQVSVYRVPKCQEHSHGGKLCLPGRMAQWREHRLWSQAAWVQTPPCHLLARGVCMSYQTSVPQFPHHRVAASV